MRRRVAFGLGANLGEAETAVRQAAEALMAHPGIDEGRLSPLYRTAPVSDVPQPDYVNAVLVADTELDARSLLVMAQAIENEHGRTREVRWGPRTLDIDVLALGDTTSDDADILVPHPRAHERAFVLVPWAAVDPEALIVGRGSVAECLAALPAADLADVREISSGSTG